MRDLETFLSAAAVDPAVYALRPDYRAMLIAVDGVEPGSSDDKSEALLTAAEDSARRRTDQTPVEQLPHIAAWRGAYRSFGAKPQRTRNSVEALIRRVGVTCRRWNWRQGRRTQLHSSSRAVLFILDVLDPMTNDELAAAADTLIAHLTRLGPQLRVAQRLMTQA